MDSQPRSKRSRRPTEQGAIAGESPFLETFILFAHRLADANAENARRTREENKKKKELATEANSQTYPPSHGVDLMFSPATPTSSSSMLRSLINHVVLTEWNPFVDDGSSVRLKNLITLVAHLVGDDFSEDCRNGTKGIEELEEIVADPEAYMEERRNQAAEGKGKGKGKERATNASPQALSHYGGVSPAFSCSECQGA